MCGSSAIGNPHRREGTDDRESIIHDPRLAATDQRREIDRKLERFDAMRPQCDTFEEAIVEVLATVLSSPQFLYVGAT